MDFNSLIKRTSNIIINPVNEWQVISVEKQSKANLILGFALPYIIAVTIATVAGTFLFSFGLYTSGFLFINAVFTCIIPLAGIFISTFIINALASGFGATPNFDNALKLVIYSYTASFLASIITGLIPILFFLGIAGLYSFYIFWVGVSPMMKIPEHKKVGYSVLSIMIIIGVYGILSLTAEFILASIYFTGAVLQL